MGGTRVESALITLPPAACCVLLATNVLRGIELVNTLVHACSGSVPLILRITATQLATVAGTSRILVPLPPRSFPHFHVQLVT
jgi:hypothetical protein